MEYSKVFPDNRKENLSESKLRQIQLIELRILEIVSDILDRHQIEYWLDWGNLLGAVRHSGFIPWDDDIDIGVKYEDYKKIQEILLRELPNDIFLQNSDTDESYNSYEGLKLRDKASSIDGSREKNTGIFIEIFPMYKVPNTKIFQKMQIELYRIFVSSRIDKSNKFKIKIRRYFSKFITLFISLERLEEKIINMHKLTKNYLYRHALHSKSKSVDYYFTENSLFPIGAIEYEGRKFKCPHDVNEYLTIAFGNYMELPPIEERKPGHMEIDKVIIDYDV